MMTVPLLISRRGLTLASGCMITVGQKGKSMALRWGTYFAPSRCRDAIPLTFNCLMDSVPLPITFRIFDTPAKSSVLGPFGTAQTIFILLTAAESDSHVLAAAALIGLRKIFESLSIPELMVIRWPGEMFVTLFAGKSLRSTTKKSDSCPPCVRASFQHFDDEYPSA
jgi:hypothetical protein